MAIDIKPFSPRIYGSKRNEGLQQMLNSELGRPAGANVVWPKSFVTIASGILISSLVVGAAPVLSGGATTIAGYLQDTPKANFTDATYNPPYTMFGKNVSGTFRRTFWPIDVRGLLFEVYLVDASFNIGLANGAPLLNEVVIGASYGMIVGGTTTPAVPSTGAQAGVMALNVDDVTNTVFKVVDIPLIANNNQSQADQSTTSNGAIIVEILAAKLFNPE